MIKQFFNNYKIIVCFIFYILITLFIFLSSLTNGKESGEQSSFVWAILSTALNIEGNYELLIRKLLGHFGIFLLLAIFASVVYYRFVEIIFTNRVLFYFVFFTLLAGLLTAVLSEIFQLSIFVSGRSAEFKDILIDFSGFLLGFIVFISCRFLMYKKLK